MEAVCRVIERISLHAVVTLSRLQGFKYELPNYLIAFPTNLLPDGAPAPLTPQQLAIKQLAAQRLLPTNGDPARAAAVYV
jgi:hypothetical protein